MRILGPLVLAVFILALVVAMMRRARRQRSVKEAKIGDQRAQLADVDVDSGHPGSGLGSRHDRGGVGDDSDAGGDGGNGSGD